MEIKRIWRARIEDPGQGWADFRDAWFTARDEFMAYWGIVVGLVLNTLAIASLLLYAASNPEVIAIGHGSLELMMVAWFLLRRRIHLKPTYWAVAGQLLLAGVYAVNLHLNVEKQAGDVYMIASTSAYLGLTLIFVLMSPLRPRALAVVTCCYLLLGVWALWGHPVLPKFVNIYLVQLAAVWALMVTMNQRIEGEALSEFKARRAIARAEQLEREKDLMLAREIQQSQLPPASLQLGTLSISCFQAKHDRVCGDWMSIRVLDDGRVLAVVADATGKGVHAALVAQAVQTLWVAIDPAAPFAADQWIRGLNTTLRRMGERKPQTMTLGLLEIDGRRVTYWSAGHIPVMARSADVFPRAKLGCRQLPGRGDLLGVFEDLTIVPVRLDIPEGAKAELMLGSDGLFDKGTRYSEAEVARLFHEATVDGTEFVRTCGGDDDRSLIHVRFERYSALATATL